MKGYRVILFLYIFYQKSVPSVSINHFHHSVPMSSIPSLQDQIYLQWAPAVWQYVIDLAWRI